MHFRGFAVAIFQKVVEQYGHLLTAPHLVAHKLGRRFQARTMPFDWISQEHAAFTQRRVDQL